MEVIIALLIILLVSSWGIYAINGIDGTRKDSHLTVNLAFTTVFLFICFMWLNLTEITYQEQTIYKTDHFSYYIDGSEFVPIPNNVVRVEKKIQRQWSLEEISYNIYYE